MVSSSVIANFQTGKDAKPIALIVQEASKYESSIYLEAGNKKVNVKSIMGMMGLVLKNGTEVLITADGPDEETALENIVKKVSLQ